MGAAVSSGLFSPRRERRPEERGGRVVTRPYGRGACRHLVLAEFGVEFGAYVAGGFDAGGLGGG